MSKIVKRSSCNHAAMATIQKENTQRLYLSRLVVMRQLYDTTDSSAASSSSAESSNDNTNTNANS